MAGILENLARRISDQMLDRFFLRLARDPYVENLWELIATTMKVTPLHLMETVLRAETGKPLGRPFGSVYHFSPWQELMFNPVHLVRLPVAEKQQVRTKVTLGPAAKKPLELEIPLIITGMSYGGALSKEARLALARAATMAGTAVNTGESAYIPEERESASRYIYQYHRGSWPHGNKPEFYSLADMVEIQLGQGAQASAPQTTKAEKIGPELRDIYGLKEGEDLHIASRIPGIESGADLKNLVFKIKEQTGGVPVAYKFAASHYLEEEIKIALEAGIDVIVIDGAEAGTHAGQPLLEDDFGLPTMHALVRADDFLTAEGVRDEVSIIAGGGLFSPGHFLKAMALGADAIYIGTAAVLAMIHTQMVKTSPLEPPTQLALYSGRLKEQLDVDRAAQSLANYLQSCVAEMVLGAVALEKDDLSAVNRDDLCALTPYAVEITGVQPAYRPKKPATGRPARETRGETRALEEHPQ